MRIRQRHQTVRLEEAGPYCHAERSEASRCPARQTLRFAQGDKVRHLHAERDRPFAALRVTSKGHLPLYSGLRQEVLRIKRATKYIFGGRAHPAIQHGRIDRAEVERIFQVAVLVQVAQTGWLTIDAFTDRVTKHE